MIRSVRFLGLRLAGIAQDTSASCLLGAQGPKAKFPRVPSDESEVSFVTPNEAKVNIPNILPIFSFWFATTGSSSVSNKHM